MARTIEKAILGVLLVLVLGIGSLLVTAVVTNKNPLSFVSSIQVDDKKETSEAQESVQLAVLAKITADDAKTIALGAVNTKEVGEVTDVEIENEDGNVVYTVEFTKDGVETDVKIDAGNGKVLLIEDDYNEADQDNEDENELEEDQDGEDEIEVSSANAKVTEEKAKQIALDEVGGKVIDMDTDRVNGRDAYEVEIRKDGNEVDVIVDMETGKVLDVEWEDEETDDD